MSVQDKELQSVNGRVDDTNKAVKKLEKKMEDEKSGASVLQEL